MLLVYGSGGHNEEMIRLYRQVSELLEQTGDVSMVDFFSLCDDDVKHHVTKEVVIVPSVTDKFSYVQLLIKMPRVILRVFGALRRLTAQHKFDFMVTTGPGVGVVCALYLKLKGVTIINIENSSRFYSKSLTGRVMNIMADYFIVQNKELLKVYSNAVYKGRL